MTPKSPDTRSIHERMVAILSELPAIGKTQRNVQQGFMFRGHDDVLNALNPLLAKHGVFPVPDVLDRITDQRKTAKGSIMFEVNLHVRYTFWGLTGDSVSCTTWGEGTDMGDKGTNKAMTMAFKNALNQAFAISTVETPDSDRETPDETVSSSRNAGEPGGAAAPEPDAGAPPSPAPSPAEPELHSVEWWDALTPEQITALVPRVDDPALLRDFAEYETNRRPRLGKNARRGVGAFLQARIKELEGVEPESGEGHAPPAAAEAERSAVSQNGDSDTDSAEPLQDLLACLAFIAEQPLSVDNASFWTPTNVLVGLSTSGAGEFSALEEVPAEWLVKVLEKVPVEIREMIGRLGPEAKAQLAATA